MSRGFLRLRCTAGQARVMSELKLDEGLGIDVSRSALLTIEDCREMLRVIPRVGRAAMSLRRWAASRIAANAMERKP